MKAVNTCLSTGVTCLVCGLAALSVVLSGCAKSQSSAVTNKSDGSANSKAALAVTSHTHDNPNETCFICDPSKRDKGRLWCKGHDRYEDRCWFCHPELEDKERLFCGEHALYEDECFLCHPELTAGGETAQSNAAGSGDGETRAAPLFCNEHGVSEIECGICQPDLSVSLEPGGNLKVRFPSGDAADKAGIRTRRPRISESAPAVRAFCEVQYNLNAMARITPLAGGVIHEVRHDIGERVAGGTVLVILHSADVASAKSDYLSAVVERDILRQTLEREKRLDEQEISARSDYLKAEAAYRTAHLAHNSLKQKLLNLGLTEDEIARTEDEQDTSAHLRVRAPFDGTLVERAAVVGEAVEVGHALFTIADLTTHWLALSIPSDHIDQIRVGHAVDAHFSELPDVIFSGRIAWVDTSVDPRSRMVRARALVTDRTARIRTGLFGEARILAGEARPAAIVPRDAVQHHEGGDFVFVQNAPDLFSLRRVALGETSGDDIHVIAGLEPNDPVVTEGSFIVMSEFLKSRLGAGCVDE